jgi:hypothetical protein
MNYANISKRSIGGANHIEKITRALNWAARTNKIVQNTLVNFKTIADKHIDFIQCVKSDEILNSEVKDLATRVQNSAVFLGEKAIEASKP